VGYGINRPIWMRFDAEGLLRGAPPTHPQSIHRSHYPHALCVEFWPPCDLRFRGPEHRLSRTILEGKGIRSGAETAIRSAAAIPAQVSRLTEVTAKALRRNRRARSGCGLQARPYALRSSNCARREPSLGPKRDPHGVAKTL